MTSIHRGTAGHAGRPSTDPQAGWTSRLRGRRWRARIDYALCGVRGQLFLLVAAALVPLVAYAAYSVYSATQAGITDAGVRADAAARIVAARVDGLLGQMQAGVGSVVAATGDDIGATLANDARLKLLQADMPRDFATLTLVAPGGSVLSSSTLGVDQRRALNLLDYQCIRDALARPMAAVSRPIRSRMTGDWAIVAVRSVVDRDGHVVAAAALNARLDAFQKLLAGNDLIADGLVTVLDRHGLVVARSADVASYVGRDLSDRIAESRERLAHGPAAWRWTDGVERIGVTATTQHGWTVFVGVPLHTVRAAAWSGHGRLLVAASVALLVALLLASALARRIAAPLVALGVTVRRYTSGELDARATVGGVAEVARLARRFNRLAERRQRELTALKAAYARLDAAVASARIGLWEWNVDAGTLWLSPVWKAQLGYAPEELAASPEMWVEHLHPADRAAMLAQRETALATSCGFTAEYRLRHRDAGYSWFFARAVLHCIDGQRVLIGGQLDITEQKLRQAALADKAERVRDLAGRISEVQETERRRIGHELHDRIGASLASLKLTVDLLVSRLDGRALADMAREVAHVRGQMYDSVADFRAVLADLRPPSLEDFGLRFALAEYVEPLAPRWGVDLHVLGRDLDPRPGLTVETALFRIVQEALNNVVRHAGATRVVVSVVRRSGRIVIKVRDNGSGFEPGATRRGNGLRIMRERAEAVGAQVTVRAWAGRGTVVTAIYGEDYSDDANHGGRRSRRDETGAGTAAFG